MAEGLFIAIEGGDGSGKGTQAAELEQRLQADGREVFKLSFPQYGQPSAKIVEMYLNGKFGEAGSTSPELTSLAYAIDRFATAATIKQKLDIGAIVIADRYVASNLAHQAASIDDPEKRRQFYDLVMDVEYSVLSIPRPELNIVLSVPTNIAQKNVDKKSARSYTDKKRDIHEANADHLENAKRNYNELCKLYPDEFTRIDCVHSGVMRSVSSIHEEIVELLRRQGFLKT